jgi:multidrug efflux pump subunit AcrA (membrane-fusion protein)
MKLDAYEDKTFSGVITEIDSTPTDQNGITKFETKIVLYNPENLKLYSGMKANVKINIQNIPDAIVVPYTAVNTETTTEKKYVSVQNEDGEKERRYVTTGYTDGQYYQITEGLTE